MIPKIIHYCWFGGNKLPGYAIKNIASWSKFFPGFEIKEWNEENFDVNIIPYARDAYSKGKFAFVSDFARYLILYQQGGVYFDTDVEVIKSFDDILEAGPFLGIEKDRTDISVAPGLGMGAYPKMSFYKKMVDFYSSLPITDDIRPYLVSKTTEFLKEAGFEMEDILQKINDIYIYPNEYFNPLDDFSGKIKITPNTHSIHFYAKSWIENYGSTRNYLTRIYHRFALMFKK